MAAGRHSDKAVGQGGLHGTVSIHYANAADRAAGVATAGYTDSLTSNDLGRVCKQLDTDELYVLAAVAPLFWELWSSPGGMPVTGVIDVLRFGSQRVSGSTTTRYLPPGFAGGTAPTSEAQIEVTRDGTLQTFRVLHNTPIASANPIVYTVRKNGVNTGISVSLAANAAAGQDLANTEAVVAGDRISIIVTKAVSVGSGGNVAVVTALEVV